MHNYDTQWTAVSRATQLEARYRAELRRNRKQHSRANAVRLRAAGWLVRTGLRIADPLTVEGLLGIR